MADWPPGIRPWGEGIQIRLWSKGKEIYSETVPGDPYKSRDLKSAIKRREELQSRLKLGLPLFPEDRSAKAKLLVDAAQDFLDTLEGKPSTQIGYENILNHYWLPALGRHICSEITKEAIMDVLNQHDISAKTRRNVVGPLRQTLDEAGVSPNPASGLKLGKKQKAPVDRYKPKEREKLITALEKARNKAKEGLDRQRAEQALAYFALLFGCGLRPGEALGLEWPDYDGEEVYIAKQITKRRLEPTTKTYERRRVYVPTWVRPFLDALPTRFSGEHIFQHSKNGPHLDTDVFNDAWRDAHKKARVSYRVPYTCRHSRAAELLSTGVAPGDAAKQLGHSLKMFFDTYAEFIDEFCGDVDKSRFEGAPVTNRSQPKLRAVKD